MLLRLLLTVLLALVAVPAPAAMPCHDATTASARPMTGRHLPAPIHDQAQSPHFCTGCIPPTAMLGVRIAAPALLLSAPPLARVARLDLGGDDPPSLPPPRMA